MVIEFGPFVAHMHQDSLSELQGSYFLICILTTTHLRTDWLCNTEFHFPDFYHYKQTD